jgi:hypothetical protein
MSYALITDGAVTTYPYAYAMFRAANRNVSFPAEVTDERLAEFGIHAVVPTDPPSHDAINENVVETTPVLVGDVWTQAWEVVAANAEDIADRRRTAADNAAKTAIKGDTFVATFIAMTPAEVSAYIETNVTSLATAKTVIEKLALMALLLARREFR